VLIGARAVQGLGAAIVSPAALSIVMTSFTEGAERNKALGVWGALGGSGAAVGVLAGGVITKYLGWEWIFFVNVPVGIVVLALAIPLVRESRLETDRHRYDPFGALTVTAALIIFVYAISKAPDVGWATGRTIGLLVVSGVLLAVFFVLESRSDAPLVPLRIFRVRTVAGANVVALILGAVVFANFFVLTLYVQQVLGYSALRAGLTFLATAGTAVLSAGFAQALATRLGVKPVLATGLVLMSLGMLWYTQIEPSGSFGRELLPGYIAVGIGLPFAFVPVTIAALAGIEESDAGLASGVINTSQQIGGAIGVAVASTVFTSRFDSLVKTGTPVPQALTDGFTLAFWVLVCFALAGLLATLTLIRREEIPTETVPAGAGL
jgi:EmrB/QacA subfamily drug resistance transporter